MGAVNSRMPTRLDAGFGDRPYLPSGEEDGTCLGDGERYRSSGEADGTRMSGPEASCGDVGSGSRRGDGTGMGHGPNEDGKCDDEFRGPGIGSGRGFGQFRADNPLAERFL